MTGLGTACKGEKSPSLHEHILIHGMAVLFLWTNFDTSKIILFLSPSGFTSLGRQESPYSKKPKVNLFELFQLPLVLEVSGEKESKEHQGFLSLFPDIANIIKIQSHKQRNIKKNTLKYAG